MQITCVTGLPGSGKSELVWNNKQSGKYVLDDPSMCDTEDLQSTFMWIKRNQVIIHKLWVADPQFCLTDVRSHADNKLYNLFGVHPEWWFFENDPDACMRNVARRNDGRMVTGMIRSLTPKYKIPTGASVLPIWQPSI